MEKKNPCSRELSREGKVDRGASVIFLVAEGCDRVKQGFIRLDSWLEEGLWYSYAKNVGWLPFEVFSWKGPSLNLISALDSKADLVSKSTELFSGVTPH